MKNRNNSRIPAFCLNNGGYNNNSSYNYNNNKTVTKQTKGKPNSEITMRDGKYAAKVSIKRDAGYVMKGLINKEKMFYFKVAVHPMSGNVHSIDLFVKKKTGLEKLKPSISKSGGVQVYKISANEIPENTLTVTCECMFKIGMFEKKSLKGSVSMNV